MTSKIKVDNINKVSDDTNIIKKCGTTTTIGSGASNPIVVDGSAVTLGRCGGTVALASGATQTGFGRTGTVDWDTTPKTATFTAVSGDGFFANTTGSAFNMNLPAGSAGAIVSVADYAGTWQTNALTVVPNGTDKIGGLNNNSVLSTEGQSVTFVFVDSTQGWINTMDSTSNARGSVPFIIATGGTITTCGDCKIHTFTGPGTFTVSNVATECGATRNVVSHMIVAAGGGGGGGIAGGGGAGGFREVKTPLTPYTASPLDGYPSAPNRITVTATSFPITVGAGGAGGACVGSPSAGGTGGTGNPSVFSTITSAGGGGGGGYSPNQNGVAGGSGGGSSADNGGATGGAGNTPPVSPAQGFPGGNGAPDANSTGGGGGGGASAAGNNGNQSPSGSAAGGPGGNGVTTGITGSAVARSGGGGGGFQACAGASNVPAQRGSGGTGGGGIGGASPYVADTAGTANTGGGGGASGMYGPGGNNGGGSAGGSGIVVIRYKFQ